MTGNWISPSVSEQQTSVLLLFPTRHFLGEHQTHLIDQSTFQFQKVSNRMKNSPRLTSQFAAIPLTTATGNEIVHFLAAIAASHGVQMGFMNRDDMP
jgi:alcohol dehydrogenase class IV